MDLLKAPPLHSGSSNLCSVSHVFFILSSDLTAGLPTGTVGSSSAGAPRISPNLDSVLAVLGAGDGHGMGAGLDPGTELLYGN